MAKCVVPDYESETFVASIDVKLMDENKNILKDIPQSDITSLELEEELEDPSMFRISLNNSKDLSEKKNKWSEDADIEPGNMIKISIGFASAPKNKIHSFIGRVRSIEINEDEENGATLELRGYDLAYDLKKKYSAGSIYNDKKYSDIVTEIATNNKLSGKVDDSSVIYENIIRFPGESDFAFLKRMSGEIGFESYVRENFLHFHKPGDTLDAEITLGKAWDIINFHPTMNDTVVVNEITFNSWDVKNKRMVSGKATLDTVKSGVRIKEFTNSAKKFQNIKMILGDKVVRSKEEAEKMAVAELKRRNRRFIEAELECIGKPELYPGMTVMIEKVEKRFTGVYYIERATHMVGNEGYTTTCGLRGCL
jgi:uncharacterized protein